MTRERRVAELLLRRSGFAPPVPVDRLAAQFADVEFDLIPGTCDGVILDVTGRQSQTRPLIVVNSSSPRRRRRFTLAHELGHLMLPWHAGNTLACSTPRGWLLERGWEPEANAFAAELLLPTTWLRDAIRQASSIRELLAVVEDANASAQATCIATARLLPPGHVWAIVDDEQAVRATGTSPNSSAEPLHLGHVPDFERLERFANDMHVEVLADQVVVWWEYRHEAVEQRVEIDPATILGQLLEEYIPREDDRRRAGQRLAGIGGSAKGMAEDPRDPEEIHARLRRAFTKSRDFLPSQMLDDPRFRYWLDARAHELAQS